MIVLQIASIVLLLLAESSNLSECSPNFSLEKARDAIFSKDLHQRLSIGKTAVIVQKLDDLSKKVTYQRHLASNDQLRSDIASIIVSKPPDEVRCDSDFLRTRLAIEERFNARFASFHHYVHFANNSIFSRCLRETDFNMTQHYRDIPRPVRRRLGSIYEKGRLASPPKYRAPLEGLNGHNSDDSDTNMQARLLISAAALEIDTVIVRTSDSVVDFDRFNSIYDEWIIQPCSQVYEKSQVTPKDIELFTLIRHKYSIYEVYKLERFHQLCRFIGLHQNESMKVYEFYMKYIASRLPRGRNFPIGLRDMLDDYIDPTLSREDLGKAIKMTEVLIKDPIILRLLYNPKEIKDELLRFESLSSGGFQSLSAEAKLLITFGQPSEKRCFRNTLVEYIGEVRLYDNYRFKAYLAEYTTQQYKLCEGLIWSDLGNIMANSKFHNMVQFEMFRTLVLNQQYIYSRPLWPTVSNPEMNQALADVFYLNNHPIPKSVVRKDLMTEWVDELCSTFHNHLTLLAAARWTAFEVFERRLTRRDTTYRPADLTRNYIGFASLCSRTDRMFEPAESVNLFESQLLSSKGRVGKSYMKTLESFRKNRWSIF